MQGRIIGSKKLAVFILFFCSVQIIGRIETYLHPIDGYLVTIEKRTVKTILLLETTMGLLL